jgi:predicted DNA-binding protein with PD1-like motif
MKSCLIFVSLILSAGASGQKKNRYEARYTKVPTGYLMVLHQDDDVMKVLNEFAVAEEIPSANFTGMGFVSITFGFFDATTKKYDPKDFEKVELVSMHGTIAWKDGKPSIHAHGVIADKSFQSFGGHILDAIVSTGSVEILIVVHDQVFKRQRNNEIGADVLSLE